MFMKNELHSDKSGKGSIFYSHAAVEYREGVISVVILCCDVSVIFSYCRESK